jgi:hypothetical protein
MPKPSVCMTMGISLRKGGYLSFERQAPINGEDDELLARQWLAKCFEEARYWSEPDDEDEAPE